MTVAWEIREGDALDQLREMQDDSVHCCVTSPPYFGLREYGVDPNIWGGDGECAHEWGELQRGKRQDNRPLTETSLAARIGTDDRQGLAAINGGRFCGKCDAWRGELGLEPTLELYVKHLVWIFREVRRVLRPDGTLWLNLGDSYASKPRGSDNGWDKSRLNNPGRVQKAQSASLRRGRRTRGEDAKEKDLLMVPATVALALRADGWWLRKEIIWHKRSPMPENVLDRPASSHEKVYLLAKSPRYFYDAEAVREPDAGYPSGNGYARSERRSRQPGGGRHLRDVWTLSSQPFAEAHFATMPAKLVEPCILAGTSEQGTCIECSGPYERVIETVRRRANGEVVTGAIAPSGRAKIPSPTGSSRHDEFTERRTLGWKPTCPHDRQGGASVVARSIRRRRHDGLGRAAPRPVIRRHRAQSGVRRDGQGADSAGRAASEHGGRGRGVKLVPISIREANRYVLHHHRHHRPTQGALFAIAVEHHDHLVGVAIVGRPVGAGLQDGRTVQITRVCTDGTRNACSFLYGRARRAAATLGYTRVITYTRQDESGASPRAAGFDQVELLPARSWARANVQRVRHDRSTPAARIRWEPSA